MALIMGMALAAYTTSHAQIAYHFRAEPQEQQFNRLINEIRCLVCQNQSLAESSAPLAHDLRQKIYLQVQARKTDAEIKDYLVKRYGEFILLRPLVNKTNFLLWSFPFLGLFFIFIIFYKIIKRNFKVIS